MVDEVKNVNPPRVVTEIRNDLLALPPREFERKAPMQGDEGGRSQEIKIPQVEKKESKDNELPLTRGEVQATIDSLVQSIIAGMASKTELTSIWAAINSVAANSNANFVTRPQAERIAKDAVPATIRDIDSSASKRTGNTLMLSPGGTSGRDSVYFGNVPSAGLTLGDKVFFGVKCNPNGDDQDLVRIYVGEIDGIEVAQTDITVTDNGFAYVRRTNSDNTMTILAGASVPAEDATYRYYKLHQFSVTDGIAKVLKYCRPFAIEGAIMPDNKNASQYQGIYLSANGNATNNNPSLNVWDFLRWA